MVRISYEKPQKSNPHQLTIDQHVFPVASIKRFTNITGRVVVYDIRRNRLRLAKPDDAIFVAKRAWDHRAEHGFMKKIEDAFQALAREIIGGNVFQIDDAAKRVINDFLLLWRLRSTHRQLVKQEILINGARGGGGLTRDQEERLERHGYAFMRTGGGWPARQLNGLNIQMEINQYRRSGIMSNTKWRITRAQEGEFLVPDIPHHSIVPITPALCVASPGQDGTLRKEEVAQVNRILKTGSNAYFLREMFRNVRYRAGRTSNTAC